MSAKSSGGLRLALTGATGDFGRAVLSWALSNDDISEVTALGRRATGVAHAKLREGALDLGGAINLEPVRGYDALVHLAYCVEEPRDKRLAHRVNVLATRALIEEANRVGVRHLVLTSSADALGTAACGTGHYATEAHYPAGDSDNGHYYFQHKALLEHLANWYWANAPEDAAKLAVVRPCYIVGEHFDNSGLRTFLSKIVAFPEPRRSRYQFLWDADLVAAYAVILQQGLTGLYNVAPHDSTSVAEICAQTKAWLLPGPLGLFKAAADILFRLRLTPYSGHWATLGDPLITAEKLRSQTGWRPSMSSAEAFSQYRAARCRSPRTPGRTAAI
ncbi:NAD-dependent epimerase/dehydratase [Segniliparus rotundus DSM 44985]|uniref:NAD-dependent epimerase/dehydratase n=1 Tax=Segniliparus rotundus (strain ATCC BAA-972 / CDC 1076 / CIP 108378 / DSM 44985 / JCM 13578) TaxID=640132 RepID=D6ZAW5_SEGRD|nr:NAD-dependent epimerase/dehydratase family protein [Segniliparus rotundus]ADG98851.1 NAD-dependent epimerase/dehydratase [Segniliparus rotundus DSM 44985]